MGPALRDRLGGCLSSVQRVFPSLAVMVSRGDQEELGAPGQLGLGVVLGGGGPAPEELCWGA